MPEVVNFDQELGLQWRYCVILTSLYLQMECLTDVQIVTEEFALRHKTIILSINNSKKVSIGSKEYTSIIYN